MLPYVYYEDAAAALAFLVSAFGFEVLHALRDEDGTVWSAQVSTGDGAVLLGPGIDGFGTRPVADPAWATSRVFVYVDDVEAQLERARAAGAVIVSELAELGPNRSFVAADPGGQQWIFARSIA